MASSRKSSAGERVLEGRHVIGLFFLMLLFSGVFFTLGYVMGRNQLDTQVRASSAPASDPPSSLKSSATSKQNKSPVSTPGVSDSSTDPNAAPATPEWESSHAGE